MLYIDKLEKNYTPLAAIFGISGQSLTSDEKSFIKEADPLGFILFARNCDNPDQVAALTDSLRDALGRNAPVLIDQEGGRVQRLKAPHWPEYPSASTFGSKFLKDFAKGKQELQDNYAALSSDLRKVGISVNCVPVLDVSYTETDKSIGDRAFSRNPEVCGALGSAVCRVTLEQGLIPVVKHMPGLGRANLDTHEALPRIEASLEDLEKSDFDPYRELLTKTHSEGAWGMVGHAIYEAIDSDLPASCSRKVIWDVIRDMIGFQNLLLTDDIDMGALSFMGHAGYRAEKALRAGCDVVLQCNGKLEDMELVAERITKMTNDAVMRYNRAIAWVKRNYRAAEAA